MRKLKESCVGTHKLLFPRGKVRTLRLEDVRLSLRTVLVSDEVIKGLGRKDFG